MRKFPIDNMLAFWYEGAFFLREIPFKFLELVKVCMMAINLSCTHIINPLKTIIEVVIFTV